MSLDNWTMTRWVFFSHALGYGSNPEKSVLYFQKIRDLLYCGGLNVEVVALWGFIVHVIKKYSYFSLTKNNLAWKVTYIKLNYCFIKVWLIINYFINIALDVTY